MYKYITDYPNQVHQLVVSVSKHYYVKANGQLAYQKKPIDVNLEKINSLLKNNIVHYLIRDHYSGLFYTEVATVKIQLSIEQFLYRAWSVKEKIDFCGLPDSITIPKVVSVHFPKLIKLINALRIEIIDTTSGFQAGVRDIRTWEENIRYNCMCRDGTWSIYKNLKDTAPLLSHRICDSHIQAESKILKWKSGQLNIKHSPSLKEFENLYND